MSGAGGLGVPHLHTGALSGLETVILFTHCPGPPGRKMGEDVASGSTGWPPSHLGAALSGRDFESENTVGCQPLWPAGQGLARQRQWPFVWPPVVPCPTNPVSVSSGGRCCPGSFYSSSGRSHESSDGGQAVTASERFGFRTFEFIEKGPFHLNGRRLLLRGTHRHEDHAGVAAAMTEDQMRQEMQMMKEMGVNFIRLGHYQQSEIILNLCDSLGILVWARREELECHH